MKRSPERATRGRNRTEFSPSIIRGVSMAQAADREEGGIPPPLWFSPLPGGQSTVVGIFQSQKANMRAAGVGVMALGQEQERPSNGFRVFFLRLLTQHLEGCPEQQFLGLLLPPPAFGLGGAACAPR